MSAHLEISCLYLVWIGRNGIGAEGIGSVTFSVLVVGLESVDTVGEVEWGVGLKSMM